MCLLILVECKVCTPLPSSDYGMIVLVLPRPSSVLPLRIPGIETQHLLLDRLLLLGDAWAYDSSDRSTGQGLLEALLELVGVVRLVHLLGGLHLELDEGKG